MTINLGDQVRCKVTGFEGVVTERCTFLTGVDRLGVQPRHFGTDKELAKSEFFDECQLEVRSAGVVTPVPLEPMLFGFGDTLKDTITGFKGKLTGSVAYLNGCRRYFLEPVMPDSAEKKPDGAWFDGRRLSVLEAASVPEAQRETGGPMDCRPSRDL